MVQLIDPATGREIAILQAPEAIAIISRLCFSPDGRQLAVATESHRIQLWDLHRVREQLVTMGLDQGFPSDQTSPPAIAAVRRSPRSASSVRIRNRSSARKLGSRLDGPRDEQPPLPHSRQALESDSTTPVIVT